MAKDFCEKKNENLDVCDWSDISAPIKLQRLGRSGESRVTLFYLLLDDYVKM